MPLSQMGLYFEDFSVGAGLITAPRQIDEADVTAFSQLTRDTNPIHNDARAMKAHPFGKPVVHGMLAVSIGVGMISAVGLNRGTLVAMLSQEINYRHPLFVGDTVHVRMEVIDKRETRSPMRGIVLYRFEVLNASDIVVVEGFNRNMVFRRNTRNRNGENI
jgi:3-hydroxybutyryl-CoA dehydratase